jgi:hypothetical protein
VQPPECIKGRPVFFSLGNQVFDQKYPLTKRGLIADCMADGQWLSCSSVATTTPQNSSHPEVSSVKTKKENDISQCRVAKNTPLIVEGFVVRPQLSQNQFRDGDLVIKGIKSESQQWQVVAKRLLSIEKGRFESGSPREFLFTLEKHPSSIDQEIGPRPYVYEVSPRGLIAKWRGSALAWPLIDGKLMGSVKDKTQDFLCALHRSDSFIALNPDTRQTRTALYQWNGFGFSGVNHSVFNAQCEDEFKGLD